VGTGASTEAALNIGADGTTLVANSSASTGVSWSAGNPIPNPVINSCFDIWQRGTSASGSNSGQLTFVADRWGSFRGSYSPNLTVSRQATSDTTNLPNIQYCARVQRNSGDTATTIIYIGQNFESANSIPYAGKTVTFSFYARAGANFSATSNAMNVNLTTGTGTDQNFLSGYTGGVGAINTTATLTTTWQRFSYTATLATSTTQIAPIFYYTPTGTAGTNDYFEVTGVQIDLSSVALPVRRNASTLQGELAACQRYLPSVGGTGSNNCYAGYAYTTNGALYAIPFPVPARVAPTGVTVSGTLNAYSRNTATAVTVTGDLFGINSADVLAAFTITAGEGSRLMGGGALLFTGCEL
jgi:hypothetical protein